MHRQRSGIGFLAVGLRSVLVMFSLATICLSCLGKQGPYAGGESHWLAQCANDGDCGGGDLRCVCGTCTRACSTDAACAGGKAASCYNTSSPLLLQRCEDRGFDGSRGLCLARCAADKDCGSGRTCMVGACLPALRADAGASDPTSSGQPSTQTSDFNGVSTDISWTDPVVVPVPQVQIAGGDQRIVGEWQEANCDPAAQTQGCARLLITLTDTGEATGNLMFGSLQSAPGMFPEAEDPDVGYPVGLDLRKYGDLISPTALVPYRMLDGSFKNGQLTFAWSPLDLWHTWCGLQKPYPVTRSGRRFDYCVPSKLQDQKGIDESKVLLCMPVDFMCPGSNNASPKPCVCSGGSGWNCLGVCRCDNVKCDADLYSVQRQEASLTLGGTRLSGSLTNAYDPSASPQPITLERVSP